MVKVRDFNEKFERNLNELGARMEVERQKPEARGLNEGELLKQSLKSLAATTVMKEEKTAPPAPVPLNQTVLPAYLDDEAGAEKVKAEVGQLVSLVFQKGLEAALTAAGRHSPFVEDAFHDALVDKLLPELKKKGIIK